jgi:branched-chain amino acid transport system permease protein
MTTTLEPVQAHDAPAGRPARRRPSLVRLALVAAGIAVLVVLPHVLDDRYFAGVYFTEGNVLGVTLPDVNLALVMALGAVALNLVVGRAGLISLGHAAFFAVGAASAAVTTTQLELPFLVTLLVAGIAGTVVGVLVGLPSLRLRGLYLMLATLALHYIVVYLFQRYQLHEFGPSGISYPLVSVFGWDVDSDLRWYVVLVVVLTLTLLGLRNLNRSRIGMSYVAIKDHPVAATSLGMNIAWVRLTAFGASSFLASVAGALYALLVGLVNADSFTLTFVIGFYAMVLLGGMGSMGGSVAGAMVWGLLPPVLRLVSEYVDPTTPVIGRPIAEYQSQVILIVTGIAIIVILRFRPDGLSGLWNLFVGKVTSWRTR